MVKITYYAVSRSLLAWVAMLAIAAGASAEDVKVARAESTDLASVARSLPIGAKLRLEALPLDGLGGSEKKELAIELERFRAFTDDARIVVHGADGDRVLPAPRNAYYRGRIAGHPESLAWLTALEKGGLRGMVTSRGRYWVMATEPGKYARPGLTVRRVDPTELAEDVAGFSCANDELPGAPAIASTLSKGAPSAGRLAPEPVFTPDWITAESPPAAPEPEARHKAGGGPSFSARLAIETDWEYFQKFGNAGDAADYAGDLIAYSSGIYSGEIDTSLEISSLSLWSTSADPWDQPAGFCGLLEFGRYWNDRTEERTLAHFLSGKSANVGIAWVGVLCSSSFQYNHQSSCPGLGPSIDEYGGAYGLSSGIDANFDIDNPSLVWDVLVVAHEIGHNFNSPHSHCYEGLGGSSEAVDQCYSGQCGGGGCYCGATELPCGQSGSGCGTLMSYCHFLSGGIGNISFNFGTGHPWGVAPARIAGRMQDHVAARAAAVPGCLDPVAAAGGAIFVDGFESGDAGYW